MFQQRWPNGFVCPKCGGTGCYQLRGRREYVCKHCHRQSSVTAGTVLHRTHLTLTVWFWAIYLVARDKKKESEIKFGGTIDDFLESAYLAGADLSGTKIENHARCIERSNQMLKLLNNAEDILRTRHKSGETYYWLLYYLPVSTAAGQCE